MDVTREMAELHRQCSQAYEARARPWARLLCGVLAFRAPPPMAIEDGVARTLPLEPSETELFIRKQMESVRDECFEPFLKQSSALGSDWWAHRREVQRRDDAELMQKLSAGSCWSGGMGEGGNA